MVHFLEAYYDRTGGDSDDIGALLGGLQLNQDDQPMDAAAWTDWLRAVSGVIEGGNPEARRP